MLAHRSTYDPTVPSSLIFDCMLFFNELDLLEIRLHELSNVVDRFVVVESTWTFSGHPKPLVYRENRDRFRGFSDRIVHVVVDDLPSGDDHWARERHQREAVARGLAEALPNDIVMLSDVDEIPRAEAVQLLAQASLPAGFVQPVYYGWVDVISTAPDSHRRWIGTRAVRMRDFTDANAVRNLGEGLATILDPGGWHFSYLGGSESVRLKLQSYSHQEFNTPEIANDFERLVRSGLDPFGRSGYQFERVIPSNSTHPRFLVENLGRFDHLLSSPDRPEPDEQ